VTLLGLYDQAGRGYGWYRVVLPVWSDEIRIAIVAEALEPWAIASHVAHLHDLNPSQLFG
jgi:transposase-like protein